MATTHFYGTRPQVNHIRDFLQSYLPFGMLDASLRKEFGNDLERIIDHLANANLKECTALRQQLLEAQENKLTSLANKFITPEQQGYLETQLKESKKKFFTACEQPRLDELLAHLEQYLFTPDQELSNTYVPTHLEEYFSTGFNELHEKLTEKINTSLPHTINKLLLRYNDIYVHLNKSLQQQYHKPLANLYTTSLATINKYCLHDISPEEYRHINAYIKLYRSRTSLSSKEINTLFPSLRKKIIDCNHDAIFYCFEYFSFTDQEQQTIGNHIQQTIQDNFFNPSQYRTILDVPFLQPYIKESYHKSLITHQAPCTLEQILLLYKNSIKNFTSFLSDTTTINFFAQQLKNISSTIPFITLLDTLANQPLSEHLESIAYTSVLPFSPLLLSPKHFKKYSSFVTNHNYTLYYSQLTPDNILDPNALHNIVTNTLLNKNQCYSQFLTTIPHLSEQLIFSDDTSKIELYQSLTSLHNKEVLNDIIYHIIKDLEDLPLEESSAPSKSLAHYLHQAQCAIPYTFPPQLLAYILQDVQPKKFTDLCSKYTQYASYFNITKKKQREDFELFIINAIEKSYPASYPSCSLQAMQSYMENNYNSSFFFAFPALFKQAINNAPWAQTAIIHLTQHSPDQSIENFSSFLSSELSSLKKYSTFLKKQKTSSPHIHFDVLTYLDHHISSQLLTHMTNLFIKNCQQSTHDNFIDINYLPSGSYHLSPSTFDTLKAYQHYLIHPLYTPLLNLLKYNASFQFTPSSTHLQQYLLEYNSQQNSQHHYTTLCTLEPYTTSYNSTEQLYDKVYFYSLFTYLNNESTQNLKQLTGKLTTLPGTTLKKIYLDLLNYSKNYSATLKNIFSLTSSQDHQSLAITLLRNHYTTYLSSPEIENQLNALPLFIEASKELITHSSFAHQSCSEICSYYFTISSQINPYHNEQQRKKILNEITMLIPNLLTHEPFFIQYYAQKIYGTLLHEGYTIQKKCSYLAQHFPILSSNNDLITAALSHLIQYYEPLSTHQAKQHYARVLYKNFQQLDALTHHTPLSTHLYKNLTHLTKPSSLT